MIKNIGWMLWLCVLWVAIGCLTIRFFGWHILFWIWATASIMIVGMIFQYVWILEGQRDAERDSEIEDLKKRLEEMETTLTELRREATLTK